MIPKTIPYKDPFNHGGDEETLPFEAVQLLGRLKASGKNSFAVTDYLDDWPGSLKEFVSAWAALCEQGEVERSMDYGVREPLSEDRCGQGEFPFMVCPTVTPRQILARAMDTRAHLTWDLLYAIAGYLDNSEKYLGMFRMAGPGAGVDDVLDIITRFRLTARYPIEPPPCYMDKGCGSGGTRRDKSQQGDGNRQHPRCMAGRKP